MTFQENGLFNGKCYWSLIFSVKIIEVFANYTNATC